MERKFGEDLVIDPVLEFQVVDAGGRIGPQDPTRSVEPREVRAGGRSKDRPGPVEGREEDRSQR